MWKIEKQQTKDRNELKISFFCKLQVIFSDGFSFGIEYVIP